MQNIPSDQEILAAVNAEARLWVNTNIDDQIITEEDFTAFNDMTKQAVQRRLAAQGGTFGQWPIVLAEPRLPSGFRCDMSRVGFIRRCWERAVAQYKVTHGLDAVESLQRIEADLRSPEKAPALYLERQT